MPYMPPSISDNFDNDNNECDKSSDETSEPMQSHNPVDSDNDQSLLTPKTCDKTETQATKKHVFRWRKKILLFLRSIRKKHLQTNQLKLIHHTSTLNSFSLKIC